MKFRLRLQKPRSFGASELHIVIWGLILKVFKNAISFSLKQFKLRNCTNQKQHLPIRNFFAPRKDTLGEIIASLVAADGLNFHQIAESEKIRKLCKNHEKTL